MNLFKKIAISLFIFIVPTQAHPMMKLLAKAKAAYSVRLSVPAARAIAQGTIARFSASQSLSAMPNLRRFMTMNPKKAAGFFGIFGGGALASCYKFTAQENHIKPFKQRGLLRIENPNGTVAVEGWEHDRLDVQATKKASSQEELDETKITFEASPDRAVIKTHMPQKTGIIVSSDNTSVVSINGGSITVVGNAVINGVVVNANGTQHTVNGQTYCSPAVDYTVKAPQGIDLEVVQQNGETTVRKISGKVDIRSSNGAIAVDGARAVKAQSANGTIEAHNILENVHARASNGSIVVSHVARNVDAQSSNGSIDVAHVKGSVNADTSTGSISIRDVLARIWARTTTGTVQIDQAQGEVDAKSTTGSVWINGKKQPGNWPF